MYRNETFHSSSSSLNFNVDRDYHLVIRSSDGPPRRSLSRGTNLMGSARDLMRLGVSRNSNPDLSESSSLRRKSGSNNSLRGRGGKVLSRSSGSLSRLKNAEFADERKKNKKTTTLEDRRAILLGPRESNHDGQRRGAPKRQSSFRNLLQKTPSFRKQNSSDESAGSRGPSMAKPFSKKKLFDMSHEETLAMLLAQEFENFDI